ncbi:LuxR C-terminal-related transcriptional regulator [Nocardia sp. NPDC057668]|uniref:helix-turn-helix transcriptional regulator n=1 Tax=Nocardia sp. NPDC057668 TaxID=3346202 RepID=UPI00366EA4C8
MTISERVDPHPATVHLSRHELEKQTLAFHPVAHTAVFQRLSASVTEFGPTVLIICSPAGTGKSVILADWLDHESRTRGGDLATAWITAHEGLDSAAALYAAVHDALGADLPVRTEAAAPHDIHAALAHGVRPTVLVFDDAHRITAPGALAALEELLAQAPPHLTVVVAARRVPALRWHPLELRGRLVRVGPDELALNAVQVRAICAQHGYVPDDGDLRAITSLTRGWAALVRMTAQHLAAHDGRGAAALTTPAHPVRAISDFLQSELLADMSAGALAFLTRAAIPDACDDELATELAGPEAAQQLAELESAGFPITRQARGNRVWFEFHPVLRNHLRTQARRIHPELLPDLHRRSAVRLLAAGEPLPALPHLMAAQDTDGLRNLLRDHAFALVLDGHGDALLCALESAGPAVTDDSYVWLLRAVHALSRGEIAAGAAYSALVHARTDAPSVAPLSWLRSLTRAAALEADIANGLRRSGAVPASARTERPPARQGSCAGSDAAADLAEDLAPTGQPDIDCYLTLQLATALALHGRLPESERALRHCLALADRRDHHRLALQAMTRLSLTAGLAGEITTVRTRAERARLRAADHELTCTPDAAHAAALAALAHHWQGTTPARDRTTPCPAGDLSHAELPDGDTSRPAARSHFGGKGIAGVGSLVARCQDDPHWPGATPVHRCSGHSEHPVHTVPSRGAPLLDSADPGSGIPSHGDVRVSGVAVQRRYRQCETLSPPCDSRRHGEHSEDESGSWIDRHVRAVACLVAFHDPGADRHAAAEAVRDSMFRLLESGAAAVTGGQLLPSAMWVLLGVNEPRLAQELVERAERAVGDTAEVAVARAAIAEIGNRSKSTRALLVPVLDAGPEVHPVTAVTAWLLEACAAERLGHARRVRHSLEQALRRGVGEGLVRPFLDVPGALALLDEYTGRFGHFDAFADRVRAHPGAGRAGLGPVLTRTELSVLRLLPSGRTAQQISEDLGVSVNTVKTHLRGIYAKLGTNTRGDTLDRARQHGIL